MPDVIVREAYLSGNLSQSADSQTDEKLYYVHNVADEFTARDVVLAVAPNRLNGLYRDAIKVSPHQSGRPGLWDVSLTYTSKPPETLQESFSTAGGTQKITQSIETVGKYVAEGEEETDFKGAIGVTEDGIEGVEIPVAGLTLNITAYAPTEEMTDEKKELLRDLTNTVNNGPWRSFEEGEARLAVVEGEPKNLDFWELRFQFVIEKNRDDIQIGDIGPIEKQGHDYLWVRYKTVKDETSKRLKQIPQQVNVERVFYRENFSALNLE